MKRRKKKKEQEQAESLEGVETETRLVFYDDGMVLYIPQAQGHSPYWYEFFTVADELDRIEIHAHPSEPDIEFGLVLNEEDNMLAIQLPDPVNDNGAPKEEVLAGLRVFLPEDHVTFLVHYIIQAKEAMGENNDDS